MKPQESNQRRSVVMAVAPGGVRATQSYAVSLAPQPWPMQSGSGRAHNLDCHRRDLDTGPCILALHSAVSSTQGTRKDPENLAHSATLR